MVPLVGGQWGEVKTLAVGTVEQRRTAATTTPQPVAWSYFSRLADAETFGRQASVETHRRGTATAQVVCAPAAGAVWQQGFLDLQRPDAVRMLAFPHAGEHLGAGRMAGQAWVRQVRRELRDGEPAEALAWVCRLPVAAATDPVPAAAARDAEIGSCSRRFAQLQ
ncbi:MAG: hypothetical protein ACYDCQ_00905 [Dehalococcoidia bacterium]